MPAPSPLWGDAQFNLRCEGRVVRKISDPSGAQPCSMAVSIDSVAIAEDRRNAPAAPGPKLREMLHDLNRQLAIVVGNADLLVTYGADAAVVARLQEVKRAALAAASIVQKIPM